MASVGGGGNELIEVLRELVDAIRENTGAMKPGVGAVGGGGAGAGAAGGDGGGGGGGGRARGGIGGPDSVSQLAQASGLMRMGTLGFAVGALDAGVRGGMAGGGEFSLMGFQQGVAGVAEDLLADVPVLGTALGATRERAVRRGATAQLAGTYGDLAAAGLFDPTDQSSENLAGLRESARIITEQQRRRFNAQELVAREVRGVTDPGSTLADGAAAPVVGAIERGIAVVERIAVQLGADPNGGSILGGRMGGGQAR